MEDCQITLTNIFFDCVLFWRSCELYLLIIIPAGFIKENNQSVIAFTLVVHNKKDCQIKNEVKNNRIYLP